MRDPGPVPFLMAATNVVGEDTFCESAAERDTRFVDLVHLKTARVEVAAVMAMATAKRAKDVDVVIYGQRNALVQGLDAMSVPGYRPSALPAGERGRYTLGGFTDATFTAMAVLEGGRDV